MSEKRTALNAVKRKSSLEKFWDSMTESEKKAWPSELKKIIKERNAFWKGRNK